MGVLAVIVTGDRVYHYIQMLEELCSRHRGRPYCICNLYPLYIQMLEELYSRHTEGGNIAYAICTPTTYRCWKNCAQDTEGGHIHMEFVPPQHTCTVARTTYRYWKNYVEDTKREAILHMQSVPSLHTCTVAPLHTDAGRTMLKAHRGRPYCICNLLPLYIHVQLPPLHTDAGRTK